MCECRTIARSPTVGGSASPPPPAGSAVARAAGSSARSATPSPLLPRSDMADGQEVQRRVGVASARDLEVGCGDGGDETRVEGRREPEDGVHSVPAEPKRELVDAKLASV